MRTQYKENHGRQCVLDVLEVLNKNMSRDLLDDPDEQEEKNILSVCGIYFLKFLAKDLVINKHADTTRIFEYTMQIIQDEANMNPTSSPPVDIEKTILKENAEFIILFLKELNVHSIVFFRVLNHLADILQGDCDPYTNVPDRDDPLELEGVLEMAYEMKRLTIEKELSNFEDVSYLSRNDKAISENILTDIHTVVASDTAIEVILDIIYNGFIHLKRGEVIAHEENQFEEISMKIIDDYDKFQAQVKDSRSKKKVDNENFLFKKLKVRVDDKNRIRNEMFASYCEEMKNIPGNSANEKIGTYKFFLAPVTPAHQHQKLILKKVDKKQYIDEPGLDDMEFKKRVLVLNTCAYIRMLINMISRPNSEELQRLILSQINNKAFLNKLMKICEFASWENGYISCKF